MSFHHLPTDQQLTAKACALIQTHLARPLSIQALASECGVTPCTLKRVFKKIKGQSLAAYSLQLRIDRAKELLVTTNNTLQMIADEVGYTEGNNFQQAFKKVVGCTPGQFRKTGLGSHTKSDEALQS